MASQVEIIPQRDPSRENGPDQIHSLSAWGLLHAHPGVRAAYSKNPSFTLGAETPNPFHNEDEMLLAVPGIQRALEKREGEEGHIVGLKEGLVFLHGFVAERSEEETTLSPGIKESVNPETAILGLQWIGQRLKSKRGTALLADVTEAKHTLRQQIAKDEVIASMREAAKLDALKGPSAVVEQEKGDSVRIGDLAKAAFNDFFKEHVHNPASIVPQLLDIFNRLKVNTNAGLEVSFAESKAYRREIQALAERVHEYPMQFTNLSLALEGMARADPTKEGLVIKASQKIHRDVYLEVMDLPLIPNDKNISKWLDIADSLPKSISPGAVLSANKFGSLEDSAIVSTLRLGSNVLFRALDRLADGRSEPRDIIDAVYTMADTGLLPGEEVKMMLTQGILASLLRENLYAQSVIIDTPMANQPLDIRLRALDVCTTLAGFGAIPDRRRAESSWQAKLTHGKLPKGISYSGDIDSFNVWSREMQISMGQETHSEFKKLIDQATLGNNKTIFGRFFGQEDWNDFDTEPLEFIVGTDVPR